MARLLSRRPHWAVVALLAYGGWFLLATGVAAWRAYTPVPIWDMWHSIGFLADASEGAGWPVWWEQVNEHRIALSRGLFWIDNVAFGGTFVFLVAVNYLLAVSGAATLYAYLRARAGRMTYGQAVGSLVVVVAWLLSWLQQENLSWAFQSQFFLAQLLPLMGFYSLYRSTQDGAPQAWFTAACAMGALSIATMISGIMALPMMVLYALVMRMSWRRLSVLLALTVVCLAAYLWDYVSPVAHSSVLGTLRKNPIGMLQYMLQYLGAPFQLLVKSPKQVWIGQCFGLLFIVLTLRQLVPALRAPRAHALELSLLTFIAFIAGIAFATAGGRMWFGVESSLSSRYTTPTMMAWTAIAILYWPALIALRGKARTLAVSLLIVLLALMMAVQIRGTRRSELPHLRMMGALSLVLGVHDARRISLLVWDENYAAFAVPRAQKHGIGILAKRPLADAAQALGQRDKIPPTACRAVIDTVQSLPEDPRFLLVTGALLPNDSAAPESVRMLQSDGTVMGVGLTDRWRKRPVAGEVSERRKHLTFTAYLRATPATLPAPMVLTAPGSACSVPLTLPAPQ